MLVPSKLLRIGGAASAAALLLASAMALAGCGTGVAAQGSFDRTYTVSGPIRLDLANASGSVRITGSTDNKVHIHGEIRARSFFFNDPDKAARDLSANPPIEQRPDEIRVGKDLSKFRGAAIDYTIEVPRNTEVTTTVASGAQTISDVQGPVKIESASGSIAVSRVDRGVQGERDERQRRYQGACGFRIDEHYEARSACGSIDDERVGGYFGRGQ